ncbi:uncharacterized protein LOC141647440 [Silene latifolia]|uniref:uncharacterized protein LOC141647440 n=1 Tax=Silene latifolia TaxID=37657 RepID=UPI003D77215B
MDANLDSPNSNTNTITTTTPSNDVVSLETNNDDDNGYYYDDSNYSTPYASAPSSPLNQTTSFFFHSAPTSPMHYGLTIDDGTGRSAIAPATSDASSSAASFEFEFEFSYRFDSTNSPEIGESMSTADELFLNGQIRPMKLSAHLNTNQDDEIRIPRDLRLRSKSRRRTRSMSPFRNTTPFDWLTESTPEKTSEIEMDGEKIEENVTKNGEQSSSSSRCSSAGRSSKRWLFLKDFLRSKSEGRSNSKFWQNISFSPAKEKKTNGDAAVAESAVEAKKSGGGGGGKEGQVKKAAAAAKRRSAHEMHYAAKRAEAEEMRKKTYLPYRQGLFGCIGFHSSNGYGGGVLHGFARVLNPVSSR